MRGSVASGDGGGEGHVVTTGLARNDVRSVGLRRNSAAPVDGVAPPRAGISYNIDDSATGGSGEASDRVSAPTRVPGTLFLCLSGS